MITIREAKEKDIMEMAFLIAELFEIEKDFKPQLLSHINGLKMLLLRKETCAAFVLIEKCRVCGMATGQLLVSTAAGGSSLLVEDFIIKENIRGKGFGGRLLKSLHKWAKNKGALRMHLLTDNRNARAVKFYKKNGFKESSMSGMYKTMQTIKL
jgi:GNAT superfamily N-acetyltransferase